MKMRARKRYNDAWATGRELFRLNQRLRRELLRSIAAYPIGQYHDDCMDALQWAGCNYGVVWIDEVSA